MSNEDDDKDSLPPQPADPNEYKLSDIAMLAAHLKDTMVKRFEKLESNMTTSPSIRRPKATPPEREVKVVLTEKEEKKSRRRWSTDKIPKPVPVPPEQKQESSWERWKAEILMRRSIAISASVGVTSIAANWYSTASDKLNVYGSITLGILGVVVWILLVLWECCTGQRPNVQ